MPKVSYVKAVDVWNFVCITFVFLSVTEYCVAHLYLRREQGDKYQDDKDINMGTTPILPRTSQLQDHPATRPSIHNEVASPISRQARSMSVGSHEQFTELLAKMDIGPPAQSTVIDRISRILFPSVFGMFCLIYFLVCGLSDTDMEYGMLVSVPCLK